MQRVLKFLKYWNYQSCRISVLTVKPSFFYAEDHKLSQEVPRQAEVIRTGSLDPFRIGYVLRKIFRTSSGKGKQEVRESGNIIRAISQLLFLPDSRSMWLPFAIYHVGRLHRRYPIHLIINTMPPFTTGIIALAARRFFKIPYILDFRDAWTHNPYLPEATRLHYFLQRGMETAVLKYACGITFVNPNLQDYYRKAYPNLSSTPNRVIRNGFDPDDFNMPLQPPQNTGDHPLRIGIMGTVYSQGNAPWTLLDALARMKKRNRGLKNKLKIVFVGKWAQNFIEKVRTWGLNEILEWQGYMSHCQALALATRFNALALAIESGVPGSENVTPGRIYEYLHLKKPILAMCSPNSDLARLVADGRAGEVVEYGDVSGIQKILDNWIQNRDSLSGRYLFLNSDAYHRRELTEDMMAFVEQVMHRNAC